MRNLKRALSLTLASVMLLGMMIVGTSAASYPDVDSNDNTEAIEVLQAVKVMQGDEKGNFRPDDSVTRAEMAVIMANLLDLDYQYYEASCPFNDVPSWARSYVGACYANGIVSGYSATTYGANDAVTPVQAASMMMRALGYFQYPSDYADGFETSTVRQGTRIGIFNDVGSSATAAMTRNQVAQLALNALECTMVDAEKSTADITVGSGDTAVTINGQVKYVVRTSSERFAYAINDTESAGIGVSGVQGATIELGEQLYSGDLKKESFENGDGILDVFGSPATRWVYKTSEIGTYADEADVTYTAEVKSKDLYKDLGLNAPVSILLDIYEDGVDYDYTNHHPDNTDYNLTTIAKSGTDGDKKLGGNGTLIKAYKFDGRRTVDDTVYTGEAVIISIVNTYLAQVDGAYNSDSGKLDLDVLSDNAPSVDATLEDDDFGGLSNFSDGEYVLLTMGSADGSTQEIMTIASAEVLTGEVDKYTTNENVTVDGTTYKYNKGSFYNNDDGTDLDQVEYEIGKESKFVLDSYGYIIGLDEVNGANSYVYIDEFASEGKYNRNEKYYADAYFTDGTTDDITLNKIDNKDIDGFDEGITKGTTIKITGGTADAGWYKYSTTNKGEYNLIPVEDQVGGNPIKVNEKKVVENGETKVIYATDESYLRGNSNTAFIIRDGNKVYTYTGIKNVGTVTTAANAASAEGGTTVKAVKSGNYATYVFVDVNNGDLKGAGTASGDVIFILSNSYQTHKDSSGTWYTYDAILNGTKIAKGNDNAVKTDDISNFPSVGLYTEVYYDDNGMVNDAYLVGTKGETLTHDDYGVVAVEAVEIEQKGKTLIFGDSANSVYLNGFIRLIDGTDVTNVTANNLANRFDGTGEKEFTGNIWATFKDGEATGVYVEVLDEVGGEDEEIQAATMNIEVPKIRRQDLPLRGTITEGNVTLARAAGDVVADWVIDKINADGKPNITITARTGYKLASTITLTVEQAGEEKVTGVTLTTDTETATLAPAATGNAAVDTVKTGTVADTTATWTVASGDDEIELVDAEGNLVGVVTVESDGSLTVEAAEEGALDSVNIYNVNGSNVEAGNVQENDDGTVSIGGVEAKPVITVTVDTPANATVTGDGEIAKGTSANVSVTAADGKVIKTVSIKVGDANATTNEVNAGSWTYTETVDANVVITVTTEDAPTVEDPTTVALTITDEGNVVTAVAQGEDTVEGTEGVYTIDVSKAVTVTISASGKTVTAKLGEDNEAIVEDTTYTIEANALSEDATLTFTAYELAEQGTWPDAQGEQAPSLAGLAGKMLIATYQQISTKVEDAAEGDHFVAVLTLSGTEATLKIDAVAVEGVDTGANMITDKLTGSANDEMFFYINLEGKNAAATGRSGAWVSEDAGNAKPGEAAAPGLYKYTITGASDQTTEGYFMVTE